MEDRVAVERSWSKTLFGNRHMLQVAGWIAEGEVEFSAPEVERATGLSASSVHRLLGVLCAVGLLSRLPRGVGERVQGYRREGQPFWGAVSQLRDSAHGTTHPAENARVGR